MRVIISGGGTGGHIYPALAIAQELRSSGAEVLYMGGSGSQEEKLAREYGFDFTAVATAPLHRRSAKVLGDLLTNYKGMQEAKGFIRSFAPDAVIGTGGFVTAPVLSAAQSLNIPTMIHEQNAYPGLANRNLARKAAAVCLTFQAAERFFSHKDRLHLTGLPVRERILAAAKQDRRAEALEYFHIPAEESDLPTLLVTGGSQGAQTLNRAVVEAAEQLLAEGWRIIHLCGHKNGDAMAAALPKHEHLILLPYLERMDLAMVLADVSLARAGASFLAEAAVLGLPTVLVPYPYATNDHQTENARAFVKAGAARMIADGQFNGAELCRLLAELRQGDTLHMMAQAAKTLAIPDAPRRIASIAMGLKR